MLLVGPRILYFLLNITLYKYDGTSLQFLVNCESCKERKELREGYLD